jgi:hypothetical protein
VRTIILIFCFYYDLLIAILLIKLARLMMFFRLVYISLLLVSLSLDFKIESVKMNILLKELLNGKTKTEI